MVYFVCKLPPFSSVNNIVAIRRQISLNFLKNLLVKGGDLKSANEGIFSLRHACSPLCTVTHLGTGSSHTIFNYINVLSDKEVYEALLVLLFRLILALSRVQTSHSLGSTIGGLPLIPSLVCSP